MGSRKRSVEVCVAETLPFCIHKNEPHATQNLLEGTLRSQNPYSGWEPPLTQSLGLEVPLEKEMATHFSILAWKIPWTEESRGLQSMESQRVGQNWATSLHFSFILKEGRKLLVKSYILSKQSYFTTFFLLQDLINTLLYILLAFFWGFCLKEHLEYAWDLKPYKHYERN